MTVIKKIWRILEDLQKKMLTKLVLSGLAMIATSIPSSLAAFCGRT